MFNDYEVSESLLADILSVSKRTVRKWGSVRKIVAVEESPCTEKMYSMRALSHFPQIKRMLKTQWFEELKIEAHRPYKSIELFAGAGGLAVGLELAGLKAVALNEIDRDACKTLRKNRPCWNVLEGDLRDIDFSQFRDIDFISGGFPCQAFSYAGNKHGFEDARGTMFFELARAIKETQPKVFLGENVRGLLTHDGGRTIATIKNIIAELGYTLIDPKVLKAIFYKVPQKRERLFLIGIRNDLLRYAKFKWPDPYYKIMTLKDALKAGELYSADVPESEGQKYPRRKKEILEMVPAGGCWVDLPDEAKREYMKGSYYLGGGKTGMARRLSWNNPSLTLTCAPAQKQTERCHPQITRPLTVREYARIQTFPDSWVFEGSVTSQYKQIGNAVPVNLSYAIGRSVVSLLNSIEERVVQKNNNITATQNLELFNCAI